MRVFLIAILVFLSACSRPSPEIPQPTIFNPNLLNGVEDSVAEPTAVRADSVVFLGDSLTHIGWWRKWFPGVETANQGIGGNMTSHVLARLDPIVTPQPDKIFLLIGANDYIFGAEKVAILYGYEQILRQIQLRSPQTRVYVQLIMPFGEDVREYFPQIRETYKADIAEINLGIALLAGKYGYEVLNTYALMSNADGDFKAGYSRDRIHLEQPGYEAWVEFLGPYVHE